MVSFQSTARISGSMVAQSNSNVEFVNHYSTAPQNIAGGRLAVRNSNLWILSNNFTTLNIKSNGHVNFVSTADPVHNSFFEEVSLNTGSINFDSDVSIDVFEVTGGTVKSTSPNGVIRAQQLTFHEDTESSTVENCNVSGREIHFIGSNVALVTSSLRIQHSGIAHSSVQLDMLNSSVLVEEGTTLAIKHKMALQTTEMEDSSILNVAGTVHVEGPKFVSSAAVSLQTTGKFTVTKDFSELDIQMTGRGSGTFNINCSHPTITFRGPGDLVLDKGSFIGPNATIDVHGGHAVITTGIEHQLLEDSGLNITLQGTGTMTLNSSSFNETPDPFTVNEVMLKSLSSNLYLSDAIPRVQNMIIAGGQVHGNAEFDTVLLQSNLQLTDCHFDIENLIIRGGNNDDKEIQASKISILASLRVETDATITLSQASVLRLASSATFTMENALEITASDVDSEASWFTNEGRIAVSLGAGRIASIGTKFNHSGELLIEDGHLSMSNDSIIRGSLQVGTSSRLTLSAGVHRIQRGSSCLVQGKLLVESSASVDVDSDDMSIESVTSHGSVTLRGETCISGLELSEGHFEVGGNAGFGALDMKTGTLSVKGDMTVNGPVKWQSGTIHLSAGASLTVNGDFIQAISEGELENQGGTFTISPANSCGVHTDCTSCQGEGDCSWYPTANLCVQNAIAGPPVCSARNCRQEMACSNFGTTEACSSQQNCTWCLASDMCVQHEQCPSAAAFWTNSAGGEWHAASNWFNDTTPGEGSDAFLTSLSEDYEVRITNAISLQALEIGSQCDHTFSQGCDTMQTLTVQRDLQVDRLLVHRNARLILGGGNLVIGSSLTVDGRMEWRQGTIRGDGIINIMGQLTIHQDCYYYCNKGLQVPLENYGRITLQTTSNPLTMSPQVNITNVGEILIKSNGVINGGTIYNEGLIYSTTPTANINSNMVQSGHLVLQQSRLQLGGNVEFLGQNSVDEGSEVLLKPGTHVFSIGSTVPSSLTLEGGTTTINTTGNAIRSLHLKNSATLQSDKDLQVENVYLEKGTLLGNGDYQINTFRWWEGNIEGVKSILVTKEMAFDDDRYYSHRKAMAESTILLQGRALVQGSQATLTMSRNASFEVTSSGEIHVPLSTTLSLRCSDGTCRTTNNGYVDVIGSLVISTDLASRGSVAVDGRVDLSGNSKFESGQIWVGSSGTLHFSGNQKDVSIGALVGVDIYGTLSVADGDVVVSSQKIAYINNIHCSGGHVQFTNTTNLKTIGTVYVRNSQITLQTGDATGLNVGKIEGRYSGNIILASPTTVSVIVLQENSSPGATIRLDSPKHAYKVLDSVTLNDGQHQIVGTVDDGGTKPTLYIEGQMNLQHYYRHFYFQNVDVSISGTLSHTCRDNRNYGVYLADGSTLTVEESGLAEVGGCNWLHSGSLPTSFTNNGVLRFHDEPTSMYTAFFQNGTMYTTANKNLHLYGQSILQGNVTIGKNAAVNFRGGSQHHILSDAMHEYSSTLNLLDDNTVLNVSTNDLRLSKVKVDSQGGRLLLFSRSDVGSVNLLELRRGSIQVSFRQLKTDEIFLTTGEISGNDAQVLTRKISMHDTYRDSFVRVANLTVTEKLLISKSYTSWTRQVTIDSFVTILHSATLVAVTRFTIYGEGEIRNEGAFLIDSTDDQWLDIRVRFINYGHLQVTNRIVLNNGGSSHGKIQMMPTAKLYLRSSKIYNLTNAWEIVGSGNIYLDSGDPVVYLGGEDDSMENPGKDIGLVVTRGKCYVDFTQARKLVQRMSISGGSIEIIANSSDPPYITEVNFLADWNYNVLLTCKIGTSVSIGKLTLRQYRTGHFGHGCGVVASNMIWYSGIINIPAYFHVIGHLDIKQDRGYKRIIATNMSITATTVAEADSTILMSDGSKIDINGSFSTYSNLRFQKEGSGTPQLVIGGQLRLLQRDKTMTVTSGISVVNYGNIEVLHGTLSIPSTECNSGTFVVAKDALIHFNSGLIQLGIDCSIDISGVSIAGNSRLEIVENGNIWQHITITSGTLVLNPNSNITVETLNVNGNVQISGQFRVRKFNLNHQGNMEVTGLVIITEEMVWSGGSLVSNQVQVDGNLYLTSTSTKYLRSGTLVATGTVTSTNPQTLVMQGDARFELQGSMAVHENLRFSGTGQNSFLNAGLINVQAGLNQYGLVVDVNFDSPGVVVVESGKMKVGDNNRDIMSTFHGNLTLKEQAILQMDYGEFTFANRSILNVGGTISIASAQVKVYSADRSVRISNIKMTSSGTLETTAKDVSIHTAEICSGTLWIHRSAKIKTLQICGGRLRPGRSVNVTELLITSGDVFSSSARPKIVARRMGWGAGRVWANDGTTAMTIQVDERLHVFGSSSKYEEYDTVIRVNGQFTMISGGNLYMSRGAIIQLNTDSTASMHHGYMRTQYNPPGRLTNMGDLTIGEYSKATTVELAVQFQMLGKLSIKHGRIRIASGGRLSGSTELFNDGRFEVTGGTLTATGASISGPGDLYVSGGILSLDGGEVHSPISITSGTLQVPTDNRVTTRGAVRIHGGTLTVDGYLECLQDVRYISGSLSGTGIVRLGNQSKILVMSTQSSDRRTTSVRSLQIFGLLEVSSSLEVRSPGVVRNEEEGRIQMTRSGAITGTGRVENYGRLSAGNMHPDIAARISSKFENFWVVEPENSSLILESSTATHKISSRVLGGVATWRNGVTLGGVTEGSVVIQGNCYVGQATVFNGNITWESGTISLQEDQCSTRWYDSSKIMRSDCSEKYVLNTGDIILETSSDKTLSAGVDLVNKGNIKWFSGKMIVGGNVKNLAGGKFEITDESNTDHHIWQNSGNTLDNNGVLLVINTRCLFQDRYGNRRGSLHNKGSLSLREESFLQIDTLTSGGDGAYFEMSMESTVTAAQIIVESGTAYLQGQINSRVHVSGGKLNVGGPNTIGSLSIEGSFFMSNTSVLEVDLLSPLPSFVSDTLTISSDIELHGKLAVTWSSDVPAPNNMDSFPIIAYGGSCRIDGLVTVALDDNVNFNTTCGESFLTVTVIR